MKNRFIILVLACFILISCKSSKIGNNTTAQKPNIVLFFVDDMGWQDTSLPFWDQRTPYNDLYITPNMERLAKEGVKFTQAYATAVCSPTRVSLMTGMNAARHRVTNWTLKKDAMQPMETNHKTLTFPEWNVNGLSPVAGINKSVYAKPLPQILHDAGYYTIHSGKAHLGAIGTPGADPLNLGFDVNIAGHAAGAPQSYLGTENFGNGQEGKEIWAVPGLEKYHGKDIFLTDALTKEAILSVDHAVQESQPFFLYMAHYAIHTPLYADKKYVQKYLDAGLDPKEAKYASMIEGMDKSLGDIMDYLEEKKLDDNTIILFMSDNGGLSALARGGEKHTHNKPLNSGKGSAYEGGIREPMLVKWPGVVKPDAETDEMLIIEDFFPTIIEMAGIKNPEINQTVDGVSFASLLRDPQSRKGKELRPLFWHYPNEWGPSGPGIGATSSVRYGDYKYLYYHIDSRKELFNITEDIGETNNLINEKPEKGKELEKILSDHLRNVDAQLPSYKSTGKRVPLPDETVVVEFGTQKKNDDLILNDKFEAISPDNIFKTDGYYNWGASIIKGEDGKYHNFYARWKREYKFYGWLTYSEVAHAISDHPSGPWTFVETALEGRRNGKWDAITAHNPKIKFFDGKYYLYYISTNLGEQKFTEEDLIETSNTGYSHPNWKILRPNQRTGVAVSESINGPWERMDHPLIEPSGPITTLTVNPAIDKGKDGKFYLILKGDKPNETKFIRNQAIAISDQPTGPFIIQENPVIDDLDTEDMSLWYDSTRERFYGVFHAHTFIGLITSENGVDWVKAKDYKLSKKKIKLADGTILVPNRMERPFIYQENGVPKVLVLAVKKDDESYSVYLPIKEN